MNINKENTIITGFGPNDYKTFYMPDIFKFIIVREITLLKDSYDEKEVHYFDIKKPKIPEGTTVKVKYRWTNLYGVFYRCEYNGETYDISRGDCKEGPLCIGTFIGTLPENYGAGLWDKRDWDPREAGYKEIDLDKYIENIKEKSK